MTTTKDEPRALHELLRECSDAGILLGLGDPPPGRLPALVWAGPQAAVERLRPLIQANALEVARWLLSSDGDSTEVDGRGEPWDAE